MIGQNFAKALRETRVLRGFKTARELARRLGISENAYTRYERAQAEPSFELIYRLCEELQATPNDLFGIPNGAARKPLGLATKKDPVEVGAGASSLAQRTGASRTPIELQADAEGWALATEMVAGSPAGDLADDQKTDRHFAEIREIGRLFISLRHDPFKTMAEWLADSARDSEPDLRTKKVVKLLSKYLASSKSSK